MNKIMPLSKRDKGDEAIKKFNEYYHNTEYKDIDCDMMKEIIKEIDPHLLRIVDYVLTDATSLKKDKAFEFHLFCLMIDEVYSAVFNYYTTSISLWDCHKIFENNQKKIYE